MLFEQISDYVAQALPLQAEITPERQQLLLQLADYVRGRRDKGLPIQLNFICTHNSRRSHLGQIHAQLAAYHYGVQDVHCFSGGTETTAVNFRVVRELLEAGFDLEVVGGTEDNPLYLLRFADDAEPLRLFSKTYGDAENPTEGFAAVMTCDHADEHCPIIPGADARLPIRYVDPKASDDTPEEKATYHARSLQILSEMLWAFSKV